MIFRSEMNSKTCNIKIQNQIISLPTNLNFFKLVTGNIYFVRPKLTNKSNILLKGMDIKQTPNKQTNSKACSQL